jgi:hypothetical protein
MTELNNTQKTTIIQYLNTKRLFAFKRNRQLVPINSPAGARGYDAALRLNATGKKLGRISRLAEITRAVRSNRGFAFERLQKAPFEGGAIGIPPALPEDCYFCPWGHTKRTKP